MAGLPLRLILALLLWGVNAWALAQDPTEETAPLVAPEPALGVESLFGVVEDEELKDVMTRYIAAMGGEDALREIQSLRITATVTRSDGSKGTILILKREPLRVRMTMQSGDRMVMQGFDGNNAWVARIMGDRKNVEFVRGNDRERIIRESFLWNPLLLAYRDRDVTRLPDEEVEGVACHVLRATFPNGDVMTYYIRQDNLADFKILQANVETGKPSLTAYPMDFQKIDGVRFAMRSDVRTEGSEGTTVLTIRKIDTNVGLLDTLFAPPET